MNTPSPHKQPSIYLGLMSGTSMDSMDGALVDFSANTPRLLATRTKPFDPSLRQQLLELCQTPAHPALGLLDQQLGEQFAQLALELLKQTGIDVEQVRAIGSHGQTVFHQPPANGQNGFSVQIADPNVIAYRTGITTVADFRRRDMAAGGQGAPLVPAFHRAVFHAANRDRIIVNLGGMANITILPASGKVTGFDTGPGNVLLDGWINRHLNKPYDENGQWAASGNINQELLDRWLREPYFHRAPPKSTGRELFNMEWLDRHIDSALKPADVQATLTALTARSIADAIASHASSTQEIFVCGGGAHNTQLIKQLGAYTRLPVESTSALGMNPQWVEAVAFAWLAKQAMEGKTGNLPEVTGARHAVTLGGIYR